MKLNSIAIDGYRHLHDLNLNAFSSTVNVVYGEKGTGKTRIADFLKSIFFGHQGDWLKENEVAAGHVDIDHGDLPWRLVRRGSGGLQIDSTAINGAVTSTSSATLSTVAGQLDAELYEHVFELPFNHQSASERQLPAFLHRRLQIPVGIAATGDDSALNVHREQTARRQAELTTLRQRLASLQQEQQTHAADLDRLRSASLNADSLDQQIAAITASLSGLTLHRSALESIDAEILTLQTFIDNARPVEVAAPAVDTVAIAALYSRLDEVDLQLRRWVSVQNDVQQQRIRLKDEMVLWNQLTLENESHPYYRSREILLNLENRVDNAQSQTMQWLDAHGPVDSQQAAGFVNDVCQGMRDDLYQLCNELGQQYKTIRHRSAAVELKQLRRCYEEMSENTDRLSSRRDAIIEEIRRVDPAGADAIALAEHEFVELAHREGFLSARQRFIGDVATAVVSHVTLPPDTSEQQNQIAILRTRRADLEQRIASENEQRLRLQSQEALLRAQRQSLTASSDMVAIENKLRQVQADIQTCTLRIGTLEQELAAPAPAATVAHPVLASAARYLVRLSNGDLTSVWLESTAPNHVDLQVRDRRGQVFTWAAVTSTLQDLTRLALVMAARDQLRLQGIQSPMLIEELFSTFESERIACVIDALTDYSVQNGQQIVFLTQHRFLIDRFKSAKWFDLESRNAVKSVVPMVSPALTPVAAIDPLPTVTSTSAGPIAYANSISQPIVSAPSLSSNASFSVSAATVTTAPVSVQRAPEVSMRSTTRSYPRSFQTDQALPAAPVVLPTPMATTNHTVSSIGVDEIGDRLESAVTYHDHTRLVEIPIFDTSQLRHLEQLKILTVAQFLELDPFSLPRSWADVGLTPTAIENHQSELWLLTCVPAMRASDAHVLVACGITSPMHLDTSDPQSLFERVERYFHAHDNGRQNLQRISIARISDWHRGLARTRDRWDTNRQRQRDGHAASHRDRREFDRREFESRDHSDREYRERTSRSSRDWSPNQSRPSSNGRASSENGRRHRDDDDRHREPRNGYGRGERSSGGRHSRDTPRAFVPRDQDNGYERNGRSRDDRDRRSRNDSSRQHEPREARPPRIRMPDRELASLASARAEDQRERVEPAETKPAAVRTTPQTLKGRDKFYLDLGDHIEAAPSIGPKTAERFEKIGVYTIEEFLKQTAESMATRLNYKRISADTIRNWQHQARLVCRIPNLRGHDAQILVACDLIEPDDIAALQPQALFRTVGPFSDSKEGQKIIRSGKKPDLEEVSDWIEWAQKNRSIQAA